MLGTLGVMESGLTALGVMEVMKLKRKMGQIRDREREGR